MQKDGEEMKSIIKMEGSVWKGVLWGESKWLGNACVVLSFN